jgi:pimeloyl-ACP methyl ester carboxylesterase/class 3 adenylate cyclase
VCERRTLIEAGRGPSPAPPTWPVENRSAQGAPKQRTRKTVPVQPETQYAESGDVAIAYQVVGDGPFDVIVVPGSLSHVELGWGVPFHGEFRRRLASFARLIVFDKRGTGMSDPVAGAPSLETRMDDLRVVLDAAASPRAAVIGISEGAPMSILFAATYPERVAALVLLGSFARWMWAADYPWGFTKEQHRRELDDDLKMFDPRDEPIRAVAEQFGEEGGTLADYYRQSGSPGLAKAMYDMLEEIDVRGVLPAVQAPTLLIQGEFDHLPIAGARYIADRIPGAQLVELRGARHLPFGADFERACNEIAGFLNGIWASGGWQRPEPDTVLATVLFSDIVGSSEKASELGDRGWRELLERHHELVRRQLVRFRGKEVDTAGDGFFASFDGPARAIRCGCAIAGVMPELGLEVRVGLHTGECELLDGKVAGIAVHTGARVAANAQPGEVLVSGTVKDLVAGSGLAFEDRGQHELKGIPGEWQLFSVQR